MEKLELSYEQYNMLFEHVYEAKSRYFYYSQHEMSTQADWEFARCQGIYDMLVISFGRTLADELIISASNKALEEQRPTRR